MIRNRVLAAAFLLFLQACSFKSIALKSTTDLLDKGAAAFYEEDDIQFARESMPGQLKFLETLLKNDPRNRKLLLSLAQGFGGYAFLFLEDEAPDRARLFYQRGRDYGLKILGKKKDDLKTAGPADAPALFWTAYCWGGWANLSRTDPQALADLPAVEAMMARVQEISPGYFYGGSDLFLGAAYGIRPKIFGGSPEKSKMHFERALKGADKKFLMAQVLYARYYAVPVQDKNLFKALLEEVADAKPDILPEQRLSNAVAKEKAKKLLEKTNDLF